MLGGVNREHRVVDKLINWTAASLREARNIPIYSIQKAKRMLSAPYTHHDEESVTGFHTPSLR